MVPQARGARSLRDAGDTTGRNVSHGQTLGQTASFRQTAPETWCQSRLCGAWRYNLPMPKAGVASLVFLVATALIPGVAQDVTPPPAGPTIRVTATEIALDLVVRDKKGRQVKNLKPADVEIYEDGVRQQVLSFRMVPGREQQSRETSQAKPAAATGAFMPLRELNTVAIVFHDIDPVTRPHAIQIVKEFIKSNLPPESYIGIFNLNEKLIPVHEFTKNREDLLASTFNGNAMDFSRASAALLTASPNIVTVNAQVNAATHSATVSVDTTGGELSNSVIVGADVSNSAGANRVRGDQVRERSEFRSEEHTSELQSLR